MKIKEHIVIRQDRGKGRPMGRVDLGGVLEERVGLQRIIELVQGADRMSRDQIIAKLAAGEKLSDGCVGANGIMVWIATYTSADYKPVKR